MNSGQHIMLDKEMTLSPSVLAVWSAMHFSDYPDNRIPPLVCYIWLRMHLVVIKSNSSEKALWK